MSFLGNVIWLVFGGIIAAIAWFFAGIILCITIVGIPFGIQCFKISMFVLWPFGKEIELGNFGAGGPDIEYYMACFIWLGICYSTFCYRHNILHNDNRSTIWYSAF